MDARQFVIGLGSSIGDRGRWLRLGTRILDAQPGVQIEASSRIYESLPVGGVAQGRFMNAALRLHFTGSPLDLLQICQHVEGRCGRQRRLRYGDRTLDLDMLWWSGGAQDSQSLKLPHPELWRRPFAWRPLLEVALSDWGLKCPDIERLREAGIDRGPLAI